MKKTLKYIALGLLACLLLLVGWGLIEPRILDVEHEEADIANLPASWEGQRIVQLSDWQIGMWLDNPGTVDDAVEIIIETKPALVMLSGDFIYHRESVEDAETDLHVVERLLQPLDKADIPVYAVLGNHDYALAQPTQEPNVDLAETVAQTLEQNSVEVLTNEAVALQAPGGVAGADASQPLYLVGIGSHYADNDEVAKALADVPDGAARVAMMHHPDSFLKFPANTAPLAVTGHTHGGQIRLPGMPDFSYQTFAKSGDVHVDGWIDGYGAPGNRLYINRGIGMSLLPLRINCQPELTVFTLHDAAKHEAAPSPLG